MTECELPPAGKTNSMSTRKHSYRFAVLSATLLILVLTAWPYHDSFAQNPQSIPDAPSATRPFPKPQVSPTSPPATPDTNAPGGLAPDNNDAETQAPAPPPNITTVPEGGATREGNTNS